jgi:NAD(P)-dependent dehydrogenase (short-subunit alcohol dehydrogenase family)
MTSGSGRLAGKVAIITVPARVAARLVKLLVEQGAKVLAARREEPVQEAAKDIGAGAIAIRADVTSEATPPWLIAAWKSSARSTPLNNAAAPGRTNGVEQTVELNYNRH